MSVQIKRDMESYERVQLKLLTYRKEDTLDLLTSLRNMGGRMNGVVVKQADINKKQEGLQGELLKIDDELFELEKKYGEFRPNKQKASSLKLEVIRESDEILLQKTVSYENIKNDGDEMAMDMSTGFKPKVEESSLTNSHVTQNDANDEQAA